MDNKLTIQDLKNGFNHSIFSTEVSSRSQLDPTPSQTNPLLRISSRFIDEPHVYLTKVKKRKKQTDGLCLQALKGSVKARASLEKVQHKTLMCRYEFLKLHQIKNFKQKEKSLVEEHKTTHEEEFRQSMGKIRRRKEINQLCFSLRKEGQVRNIEALQEARRQNEMIFRETIRINDEKVRRKLEQITERVKREKAESYLRRKNLNELSVTRSKFNYLSKINEEMQIIKDYHDQLELFKLEYVDNEAKETKETALPIFSTTISSRTH